MAINKKMQNMYMMRSFFSTIHTYMDLTGLNTTYSKDELHNIMQSVNDELLMSTVYIYYKDDEFGNPLFVPYRGMWTADMTRRVNVVLETDEYLDLQRVNHSTPMVVEAYTDDDAITFRELMMYCSSSHPEIYKIYSTMVPSVLRNAAMNIPDTELQYLIGMYTLHAICVDIFDAFVVSPYINKLCGESNIHTDVYEELSLRFMNTLALNTCSSELLSRIFIEDNDDNDIRYILNNIYNSYKLGDIEYDTLNNLMSHMQGTPYMTFKVAGCCTKLIGTRIPSEP